MLVHQSSKSVWSWKVWVCQSYVVSVTWTEITSGLVQIPLAAVFCFSWFVKTTQRRILDQWKWCSASLFRFWASWARGVKSRVWPCSLLLAFTIYHQILWYKKLFSGYHPRLALCCAPDNTPGSAGPPSKAEVSQRMGVTRTTGRFSRELWKALSGTNTPVALL